MIRCGAPMKDRREKRQTERSARERFELDFATDEGEATVAWLCGCGNGSLACPESEVPDFCGLCGQAVKGES